MPTYIALGNFTDQGIRTYKDTVKRAKAFQELVQQAGGSVKDILWTMGTYDIVATITAPDDETATMVAIKLGSQGNVRTTTMRAFTMDEVAKIIQKTD
jgi:uncharacterized protein with GYD domain